MSTSVTDSPIRAASTPAQRRRVRVLVTIPNLAGGGAERMAVNLARHLDPARFDCGLFLHEKVGPYISDIPEHIRSAWYSEQPYNRRNLPLILWKLLSLVRDYDVILAANEGRASALAFLAGRMTGKPVVGWIHNNWQEFSKVVKSRQIYAIKALYPMMQAVVCCSDGARRSILEIADLRPERVTVIPNFIELRQVIGKSHAPVPDSLKPVLAKPTVVGMGRLAYQKGFDRLLQVHANVLKAGFDHHLLLLGEGDQRESLRKQAQELGVSNSVFMPGRLSNPFPVLKHATAFGLASRFEGWALALLETLACGVPTVAMNCPSGVDEVFENGRYGVLVPPDDVDAMTRAMLGLLRDPALRAKLSAQGPDRAASFTPEHLVPRWEQLFDAVFQQSPNSR